MPDDPRLRALERILYDSAGQRRLPGQRSLDRALAAVQPEELFWFCERRAQGPLYLLPTREFVTALASWLRELAGAKGRILEVGAGDGFLSAALLTLAPALRLQATDSGAWERPAARLTRREASQHRGSVAGLPLGAGVQRLDALTAIHTLRPTVVLAAWLPPGRLLDQLIRSPCRYVVELGAGGGVTAQGEWGWRFAHDFGPPALERRARCRLDGAGARRSQITVYYGRSHPEHGEERPRPGDWLWQFRPRRWRAATTSRSSRPGSAGRARP